MATDKRVGDSPTGGDDVKLVDVPEQDEFKPEDHGDTATGGDDVKLVDIPKGAVLEGTPLEAAEGKAKVDHTKAVNAAPHNK